MGLEFVEVKSPPVSKNTGSPKEKMEHSKKKNKRKNIKNTNFN
jgi:hypothetical protein